MSENFHVRKVAVLGAGVMGAQIANHLSNADVPVVLFELPAKGDDPYADVNRFIQGLRKMQPNPSAKPERIDALVPAIYTTDMEKLRDCDFVLEVIAERVDWKYDLYSKVVPYLSPNAILATNTSGLSIDLLAEKLPEKMKSRFCGVHFFNPPRYMPLVELIPGSKTDPSVLDNLETFLVKTLGKSVVRAKDTPNFVGNRIGVFSIVATMCQAARLGIPFDVVDDLTGSSLGRPKSATFRTADVVGLDTLAHILDACLQVLKTDPWQEFYVTPPWLKGLIDKGALGQKTKAGVFRKEDGKIMVLDTDSGNYRKSGGKADAEVAGIMRIRDQAKRFKALRESKHPQAEFVWAIQRETFHYAAVMLGEIANSARDIDMAMRWGYGWKQGPFEIWQEAGWKQIAQWIEEDMAAGKTMTKAPLPAWVKQVEAAHTPQGSWSAIDNAYRPRSALPVYKRQYFPEQVLGEAAPGTGKTVYSNDGVRLWHLDDAPDIGIVSIQSKMHAVGEEVLDGMLAAIDIAEKQFAGLVVWDAKAPFSVGANLAQILPVILANNFNMVGRIIEKFQAMTSRLRYSLIPTVAAVQGLALGGGCEILLHCDRVVAALESYIGLVEVGVGVIPAGGGSKEAALRASQRSVDGKVFPFLKEFYTNIAMAKVSMSAQEAQKMGWLRDSDIIVFNVNEILYIAIQQARAMAESAYRPPVPPKIKVAGRTGIATIKSQLVNMRDGNFISEHDYYIGSRLAEIVCGGDVEAGSEVDECILLKLEREVFVDLLHQKKTMDRIGFMLETNKPLRN
ncbi:MAG: 3-hydroxyacyl-CoA dehydrogenase [Beggiatoa sp. IS2]|nr:MAG: 3-hydroxyacyl-CoA dehydrogenase [Beggiatoa sp. IS2]